MSARLPGVQFIPRFVLESGKVLHDVRQAFFLDGRLDERRENLVLVFHALTGSADAAGDWWREVIGPGRAIDTDRYAVLCANLLGGCYGTTGPSEPDRQGFPRVTTRDMARLTRLLLDELGIERVVLATGGSLGGMVALEWAATYPDASDTVAVFAAPAAHTASAIAWNHIQRRIIAAAGEGGGLEIARMIGMMTYRTPDELETRFGRAPATGGGYAVEGYLNHHGDKLRARFDTATYLALLDAMDSHDVGRGRGGVERALAAVRARLVAVGIPGDLLYTERDVRRWAGAAGAEYREIHSVHGHDSFLLEPEQVSAILREALPPRASSTMQRKTTYEHTTA
jgi:homoserine O-acetyltransferase/O-succinyltransferase